MNNETTTGKKNAARQWVAVNTSYDETTDGGEKRRQTMEFIVEAGTFGYAEKSVRALLTGRTGVNVTSCRRKYVNRLVFAQGADNEKAAAAEPWLTYEATAEATDDKGKKTRRAYLIVAPSFAEACTRLMWAADPTRERILSVVAKPRMTIVTGTDEKDM